MTLSISDKGVFKFYNICLPIELDVDKALINNEEVNPMENYESVKFLLTHICRGVGKHNQEHSIL